MSFSGFSYPDVLAHFGLTEGSQDLFTGVPDRAASSSLLSVLDPNLRLANLINTEKARSELLVSPVLSELWRHAAGRLNLHSGTEFNADPEAQLTGFVDFIIGLGPQLPRITTPIVMIFEAKRDNISDGYGQCIAAMVGAEHYNRRLGNPVETIYGCVTTGSVWKFLKLSNSIITFDLSEHSIQEPEHLLGILSHMVGLPPAPAAAA